MVTRQIMMRIINDKKMNQCINICLFGGTEHTHTNKVMQQ